jgi:hypothetical protein
MAETADVTAGYREAAVQLLLHVASRFLGALVVQVPKMGLTMIFDTMRWSGELITSVGNLLANFKAAQTLLASVWRHSEFFTSPARAKEVVAAFIREEWCHIHARFEGDDGLISVPRWFNNAKVQAVECGLRLKLEIAETFNEVSFCKIKLGLSEWINGRVDRLLIKDPLVMCSKIGVNLSPDLASDKADTPLIVAKAIAALNETKHHPIVGPYCIAILEKYADHVAAVSDLMSRVVAGERVTGVVGDFLNGLYQAGKLEAPAVYAAVPIPSAAGLVPRGLASALDAMSRVCTRVTLRGMDKYREWAVPSPAARAAVAAEFGVAEATQIEIERNVRLHVMEGRPYRYTALKTAQALMTRTVFPQARAVMQSARMSLGVRAAELIGPMTRMFTAGSLLVTTAVTTAVGFAMWLAPWLLTPWVFMLACYGLIAVSLGLCCILKLLGCADRVALLPMLFGFVLPVGMLIFLFVRLSYRIWYAIPECLRGRLFSVIRAGVNLC